MAGLVMDLATALSRASSWDPGHFQPSFPSTVTQKLLVGWEAFPSLPGVITIKDLQGLLARPCDRWAGQPSALLLDVPGEGGGPGCPPFLPSTSQPLELGSAGTGCLGESDLILCPSGHPPGPWLCRDPGCVPAQQIENAANSSWPHCPPWPGGVGSPCCGVPVGGDLVCLGQCLSLTTIGHEHSCRSSAGCARSGCLCFSDALRPGEFGAAHVAAGVWAGPWVSPPAPKVGHSAPRTDQKQKLL